MKEAVEAYEELISWYPGFRFRSRGSVEPAVAADGAGISAFRGSTSVQPAPLLNFFVRRCQGADSRIIVSNQPPLKPLHADSSLIHSKLDQYGKLSDQELIDSLKPGQQGSLKVRPDGTIVDGHHRIKILRGRGVDVDSLPRDIIPKDADPDLPQGPYVAMRKTPCEQSFSG